MCRDLQRYGRALLHPELRLGQAAATCRPEPATSTGSGLAFYTNYAFTNQWRVSLRAEYLDDKDGFLTRNTVQKLKEGTLTFGFAPVKSFELRLEARYDKSDKATFVHSISEEDTTPFADNQTGFALQGVYRF